MLSSSILRRTWLIDVKRFEHDCVGALLVRDGRILLGRRADDRDWLPGAWDLFGGHIEAGEDAQQAVRRELREELGVAASRLRALGILEDETQGWRLHVFAVDAWSGAPRNRQPEEHAQLRWMSPQEAIARLVPAHAGFAQLIEAAIPSGADP